MNVPALPPCISYLLRGPACMTCKQASKELCCAPGMIVCTTCSKYLMVCKTQLRHAVATHAATACLLSSTVRARRCRQAAAADRARAPAPGCPDHSPHSPQCEALATCRWVPSRLHLMLHTTNPFVRPACCIAWRCTTCSQQPLGQPRKTIGVLASKRVGLIAACSS